jgi:L-amino acid N-acyltransferase YncA
MIRDATSYDAVAISAIYAHYVATSVATFEEVAPSADAFVSRMADASCWLVHITDGVVDGYAYAGRFHPRAAYRWSQEVSVYLDAAACGRGIGGALVDEVLTRLRRLGAANAMAGISLPNPASSGLFESRGFTQVATYPRIGFKDGQWIDVGWWQLPLLTNEAFAAARTPQSP